MMIPALFSAIAARHPDRVAVVDGPVRLTFAQLRVMQLHLASHLAGELGLDRGARIAVILPNCWQFVVSFLAISHIGGVCIPLNPQWRARELQWCARRMQIAAAVTTRALAGPWLDLALVPAHCCLMADPCGPLPCPGDVRIRMETETPAPAVDRDSPAVFLLTSGSTGHPKIVPRTHENLVAGAQNVAGALGLVPGRRFLSVVPFHHANGFSNCMFLPLSHGSTAVLLPRFAPLPLAEVTRRESAEVLIGSPFIFRMLVESGIGREGFAAVDTCLSSGAAMSRELVEGCRERLGLRIRQLYGSTETGTVAIEPDRDPLGTGLVGRPIGSVEVRILDPAGQAMLPGVVGEVAVRSPAMMKGYFGEVGSEAADFSDGYFRTGDLGMMDTEGNLTLLGRSKRLINLAGIKADPVEIENALREMDEVADCIVGAVRDPRGQEIIKAVIALRPGRSLDRSAVVEHCRGCLAEYKIPRIIELVEALPWDMMGKLTTGWRDDAI